MFNTNDLYKLRRDLESRADILKKKIKRDQQRATEEEYSTELSNYDNHPGDQGTELYERERDFAIVAHEKAEADAITKALDRMDADHYGKCETCGKEIDLERLKARPESIYCLEHAKSQPHLVEEVDYSMSSLEIDDTDSWKTLAEYGTSESPSDFSTDQMDYNQLTEKKEEEIDQLLNQDNFKSN